MAEVGDQAGLALDQDGVHALQFGRPVFGLEGAPAIDGVTALASVEDAGREAARVVLGLGG
jgi:hypothetical protein